MLEVASIPWSWGEKGGERERRELKEGFKKDVEKEKYLVEERNELTGKEVGPSWQLTKT